MREREGRLEEEVEEIPFVYILRFPKTSPGPLFFNLFVYLLVNI